MTVSLDGSSVVDGELPSIRGQPARGVVFDLDGTLVDSGLDFERIRTEMGLPPGIPILEALNAIDARDAARCRTILDHHEQSGALRATLLPGVAEFLGQIAMLNLRTAVVTRNSRTATQATLDHCGLRFCDVLTRDDGPVKPDPWCIHELCRRWRLAPPDILMLGDFHFDVEAGRSAGARTVLVCNDRSPSSIPGYEMADYCLPSFDDSADLLRLLRGTIA